MPSKRNPRRGSLQFWPRKRAKKHVARVRSWNTSEPGAAGFVGYKAGMTSITYKDPRKNSPTSSMVMTEACTIIECPATRIFSVRFYINDYAGLRVHTEVVNPQFPKALKKFIPKITKSPKLPDSLEPDVVDVRCVLATQPHLTGIGKKKPDFFEVQIGGKPDEQLAWAKEHLDKDVTVHDVFKEGEIVDIHAVTKGKGFQGTVKRYGVKILSHKAEKKKRGKANLGAWTPSKVSYTIPQPGKMGYHLRTDYNKQIFRAHTKEDAASLSDLKHYGVVKNDYILIKGSVQGPQKRAITMTRAIRPKQRLSFKIQQIQ